MFTVRAYYVLILNGIWEIKWVTGKGLGKGSTFRLSCKRFRALVAALRKACYACCFKASLMYLHSWLVGWTVKMLQQQKALACHTVHSAPV